jgi:signal transduction histidine kinase
MMSEEQKNKSIASPADQASPKVHPGKIADRLEAAHASLKSHTIKTEDVTEKEAPDFSGHLNFIVQYHELLLAKLPRGILAMDLDGNVTTYNKMAAAILSVPREEVLFQPFWKNFDDNILGFSIRQCLKEKKSPGTVMTTAEGTKGVQQIESEISFIPHPETRGNEGSGMQEQTVNGLIILLQDVSEQRHFELVSQQKHQMNELGELAAALAHEIRNPLGGIKGFASLLERDLVDRPDLKKMAAYIIEGTNNLNNLVTRVLDYARPIKTHFEVVDLVPLIKQLRQEILKEESYNRNIKIDILSNSDSIITAMDPQSIRKSIQNLVVNAIQSMSGAGGTVTIALEKYERSVSIKVADTGIGISPDNIKKVFSPFFTTKPDANGFGLPETYKIAQLHGGKIDVNSKEGMGSTFTLSIPLSKLDGLEQNKEEKKA